MFWVWRAHNEVNERLVQIKTELGHSSTGDAAFPKVRSCLEHTQVAPLLVLWQHCGAACPRLASDGIALFRHCYCC
jgi:hypothetical protein